MFTLTAALDAVAAGSLTELVVVDMRTEPWRSMRDMGMLHEERRFRRRRRPRRYRAAVDLTAIGWGTRDVLQRTRCALDCFEQARWHHHYLRNDLEAADHLRSADVAAIINRLDFETSAGRCRHGSLPIGHHQHGAHP